MFVLNDEKILESDNRDCHSTIVKLNTVMCTDTFEITILMCIELIDNMLENNPEVMISTKDLHECLEELKGELVGER